MRDTRTPNEQIILTTSGLVTGDDESSHAEEMPPLPVRKAGVDRAAGKEAGDCS